MEEYLLFKKFRNIIRKYKKINKWERPNERNYFLFKKFFRYLIRIVQRISNEHKKRHYAINNKLNTAIRRRNQKSFYFCKGALKNTK